MGAQETTNTQISTLSVRIRQARHLAGLTQQALADRAGISVRSLKDLERGGPHLPRHDTIERIVAALDLAPEEQATLLHMARIAALASDRRAGTATTHAGDTTPVPLPAHQPLAGLGAPTTTPPALAGGIQYGFTSLMPLLGRADDIARVGAMLLRPTVRLLTLMGAPGVGKTRLGAHIASELADQFADGARSVSLAPLDHADQVVRALAHAVGVKEDAAQPLFESLCARLSAQRLLLLLDNFEHVQAAAPLIADILERCPDLTLLCTSRAPLRIRGEYAYLVEPLPIPNPLALPDLAALAQEPTIALFVGSAQRVAPGFVLTRENAATVASICATLDGLPLALELAAPHLKLLSPDGLLTRLMANPLPLLGRNVGGAPAHQQTVEQTLQWSYALLTPQEQALLRSLSIFRGGATIDAIASVFHHAQVWRQEHQELSDAGADKPGYADLPSAESDDAEHEILFLLEGLFDQNLIQRTTGAQQVASQGSETPTQLDAQPTAQPDDESRIGVLYVVREFGERLLRTPHERRVEREAVRRAHAYYYMSLAERASPELTGAHQADWTRRLEREHDNVRAALTWATETETQGEDRDIEARREIGLRLAAALSRFWYLNGYLSEGRRWLELLLAPYTTLATQAQARKVSDKREETPTWLPLYMKALHGLEILAFHQADYPTARRYAEQCLALTEVFANDRVRAGALNTLANIAKYEGDYAQAIVLYEECLALLRALGETWSIAVALANLAGMCSERGEYERSRAFQEESLRLRRALGDTRGIAESLGHLGALAGIRQDYSQAIAYLEECIRVCEAVGYRAKAAHTQLNLAETLLDLGEYARAEALAQTSFVEMQRIGDSRNMIFATLTLGLVAYAQGAFHTAVEHYSAAVASAQALHAPAIAMQALGRLGIGLSRQGQHEEARHCFQESLAIAQEISAYSEAAMCLEGLAATLCYDAHMPDVHSLSNVISMRRGLMAVSPLSGDARRLAGVASARLLAAAARLREELHTPAPRIMREVLEDTRQAAREACGDDACFDAAWTAGQRLTLEESIAEALAVSATPANIVTG